MFSNCVTELAPVIHQNHNLHISTRQGTCTPLATKPAGQGLANPTYLAIISFNTSLKGRFLVALNNRNSINYEDEE